MDATQTISEVVNVTPWSRQIYHDADSFWQESKGLHYAYIVYRTLRGDYKHIFQSDAVLYVGKSPAAYLKKVKTNRISDEDIRQWQRFLWNQAVVPLLIVKSLTQVHVYTAYTKPEKKGSEQRIQSILEDVADTLELDQLWIAIESGMIYKQKPDAFSRDNAVDQYLLDNLNATALQLSKTQPGSTKEEKEDNLKFAHHFLTRLLFVCYLIERGMIGKHFNDTEHEILKKLRPANHQEGGYFLSHLFNELNSNSKKRDALCRIFGYVKRMFNGSLFPDSITKESDRYSDDFIQVINNFLNGDEIKTGQRLLLGFWAYDFSVIPIETISAVYESFLGEQGKLQEAQGGGDSKRATGAYYTPLHLAELTVDIALESIKEKTNKQIHELKILDPACGSGVFLVSLFGRMAESFYREASKTKGIDWARKLKPKLHQLYGIDISQTACHITCFSLYLAFLEWLEPSDVEYLHKHGEQLPALLANTEKDGWDTIRHGNLFNPELSFNEKNFDVVIGNPPWVSGKNQKDTVFLKWMSKKPHVLGPNKQIAHGFAWKAPEYLSDSGIGCFLLPSSVLFNEGTDEFQKEWLNSVVVERVVNFSDLRFVLFSGSVHPCVAIRFGTLASKPDDSILYESPKTDALSQKGGPVYIREEDTTILHQKEILHAAENKNAPVIWRSHFWGSWRDRRLLSRLSSLPRLNDLTGKTRKKGKRWDKSLGVQIGNQKHKGWWNNTTLYIKNTDEISLVIIPQDCQTVQVAGVPLKAERPRREELFEGPKVLVSQGSLDMKVALCNFTVLFQNSLYMITGNEKDIDLLRLLSVVIKSDVVQYYLWHTSANWGIERDKVVFYELLSLPFFLPEDATDFQKAQNIVDEVANTVKQFERRLMAEEWFDREEEATRIRRELEPKIRDYYDIDKYEDMLIDDTLGLAVKSFHPRQDRADIPTLRQAKEEECRTYTQTLCEMLNNFGKGSQFKVRGEVFKGMPYSVVHVSLVDRVSTRVPISNAKESLACIIKKMGSLLQNEKDGFVFCQNLKVFDGDSLYLLKPMQMRFWSRAAALNDADEIAGAIVKSRRES